MYADRSNKWSFNPGSMGVALGINAAFVAALMFAAPELVPFTPKQPPTPIDIRPDEPPLPPPPPEPVEKRIETRTPETPLPPPPLRQPDVSDSPIQPSDGGWAIPVGPAGVDGGLVGGTGTEPIAPPQPAPPVIVAPGIDPRYADALQPTYPPEERRAGRAGRVVARVLVGTDGRVKDIERVSAASDAFWRATEDQARRRWRFRPGTRDGVPVEAWRVMTLTFRLED